MANTTPAKHTPGPWHVRLSRNEEHSGARWEVRHLHGHDWHVADVFGVTEGEQTYGHGMAEANAKLIAAAPAMLEALEQCLLACRYPQRVPDMRSVVHAAEAAIRLAKGEL